MGVRRYSRDPQARAREQHLDHLQLRCLQVMHSPTLAELRGSGIARAYAWCRNGMCGNSGAPFALATLPGHWTVMDVRRRRRFTCGRCGTPRAIFRLEWS